MQQNHHLQYDVATNPRVDMLSKLSATRLRIKSAGITDLDGSDLFDRGTFADARSYTGWPSRCWPARNGCEEEHR